MDDSKSGQSDEFRCPTCNKKFTIHAKFNKHLETHNVSCDKCNINFKTYNQKRLHDRSYHRQSKDKMCRICPEVSFKTEEEYLLHIRDIHKGKLIDCYMCNVCGKTFKTRSELRQHINSKCGTEKMFICKVCGQKLMSPGSLYNHMRRHSDMANFMCRFCAKLFHTAGQLKVHERIHTQQKDFICDVCGKGFCHRQSLITHSTVHTGIKPYLCEGCGNSFSCVGNLLKHRKSHAETCGLLPLTTHRVQHPSTKIKVKINTPSSSKLKEVKRNKELQEKLAKLDSLFNSSQSVAVDNHGESNQQKDPVENCDRKTEISNNHALIEQNNSKEMETLKNNREDTAETENENMTRLETDIENEVCEEETYDSSDNFAEADEELTLHLKQNRRSKRKRDTSFDQKLNDFIKERKLENGKTANCKYCNKEYTIARWLYRHEKEHEENGECENLPFKCSCCKKCFRTKEEVKHHQQLDHSDILSCHDCGDKIFANTDSLRSHRNSFHKGLPRKEYIYICEKCGKKFKQKTALLLHNQINCGKDTLFQCDVCQKEYSSERTRKAHMRIHTSEKSLVCKFCGKAFHWKGQLKVHERSHTGEKPYTCLFCPSAFAYRDSLITHSTLHTGIKPYFCKSCGWRFSCIGNLVKHKVTHASTCGVWYQRNDKEEIVLGI